MCKCTNLKHNRAISYTTRYFELLAFAVNGKVAEEVFYLTDMVNMLQVVLFIAVMDFLSQKENRGECQSLENTITSVKQNQGKAV